MGANRTRNKGRKKNIFEVYMDKDDVTAGLKRGELIQVWKAEFSVRTNIHVYSTTKCVYCSSEVSSFEILGILGAAPIVLCGILERDKPYKHQPSLKGEYA